MGAITTYGILILMKQTIFKVKELLGENNTKEKYAGVSIKAGYRRSTAAYKASYHHLLRPKGALQPLFWSQSPILPSAATYRKSY